MEQDELFETEPINEDDTDELLEKYEKQKRAGGADDAAAMQAIICLLIGLALLVTDIFYPEMAAALLEKLRQVTESTDHTFPNPIDWIVSYWQG